MIFKKKPPFRPIPHTMSMALVDDKGKGKSTYLACLANKYHNSEEPRYFAEEHTKKFNEGGFKNLKVPETLVYSDVPMKIFDEKLKYFISSNIISPYNMQIANDIDEFNILPFGSLCLFDETEKTWRNRDSASFPERVEAWWWVTRQLNTSMICVFHDPDGIEKKLRENFDLFRYINNMEIKFYSNKSDSDGYRQIKSVKFRFWQYDKYEYFLQKIEPLTKTDILKILWRLYNPTMWFPFNLFHRIEKSRYRDECFKSLERLYIVQEVTEEFKFNPFERFDSYFFELSQYTKSGLSKEEYKKYAENLKYTCQDNNSFMSDKVRYGYNRTVDDIFEYSQDIVFEKPETFTKDKTARETKAKRENKKV